MIFGVDVHPQFQAGLNIEQVRAEGFDFIAVKLSEANTSYNGIDWLRRATACGLLSLGYHYLRPGNETNQAKTFTKQAQAAGGVPGMLDAEALADDGKTPTLTVAGIRRFLDECGNQGTRVPFIYLPRWYHQRMGSPDLSGLPMLWASSYVTGSGYASTLYERVTPSSWKAYGNLPVAVLQFTDQARVAGQVIDADAFLGSRDQFASLIGRSPKSTRRESVITNYPVTGQGGMRLGCPVGSASTITARAWISAMMDGPEGATGHTDVWFQSDTAGIDERHWDLTYTDGLSTRQWAEVPSGTTQINIVHNLPGGGTICLETLAK